MNEHVRDILKEQLGHLHTSLKHHEREVADLEKMLMSERATCGRIREQIVAIEEAFSEEAVAA